jgi:hypothetical protein
MIRLVGVTTDPKSKGCRLGHSHPKRDRKCGLPDTNCLAAIPSAGTPCAPLFNYFLEYAIDESYFTRRGGTPDSSAPKAPNIFKALEKLGLQLEKTKAPREFIVIEHIERLSPN